jgi:hypothetical protein
MAKFRRSPAEGVAITQTRSCSKNASNLPHAQAENLRLLARALKLLAELGARSLAVGIVLVVLIPFPHKLITEKAETPTTETATVVPVA